MRIKTKQATLYVTKTALDHLSTAMQFFQSPQGDTRFYKNLTVTKAKNAKILVFLFGYFCLRLRLGRG